MISRRFPGLLVLLLGLLVLGAAWAQEPPADRQKKTQPDTAGLERRIAELEAQLAKLTKELEGLRTGSKAPPVSLGKSEVNVFTLKHAKATAVAKALQDLFPEKDGLPIRIASDPSLNTLVVRAGREELEVVEAVISKLEAVAQERNGK